MAQLTQDTLDHGTSLGLNGRRFRPGKFPQLAVLKFKVLSLTLCPRKLRQF